MPVKLKVMQESASGKEQEYLYHEDVITLGRKESNLLLLPDPFKKLVSRRHARIERNGAAYYLFDLESQNHTFLNGTPLQSGQPYQLHNGDEIRIGDYHIHFYAFVLEGEAPESGEVALHPFVNETNELQRVLLRLVEKYARAEVASRSEVLLQALREPLRRLAESDLSEIFTRAFTGHEHVKRAAVSVDVTPEAEPHAPGLNIELLEARAMVKELSIKLEEKEAGLQLLREEIRRMKGAAANASKPDTTATQPLDTLNMSVREKQVLELLLDAFVRLSRGYYQYLGDVAPTTIMQPADSLKIRHSTPEELHKLFFDPNVPEKKIEERINMLKQAVREVVAHPLALLEGHRACVRESPRSLLHAISPEHLKNDVLMKAGKFSAFYRVLPFLWDWSLLRAYRKKHGELSREDNSTFAFKHFEQIFQKHYNKRMDPVRAEESV